MKPSSLPDLFGLVGDVADNIPGETEMPLPLSIAHQMWHVLGGLLDIPGGWGSATWYFDARFFTVWILPCRLPTSVIYLYDARPTSIKGSYIRVHCGSTFLSLTPALCRLDSLLGFYGGRHEQHKHTRCFWCAWGWCVGVDHCSRCVFGCGEKNFRNSTSELVRFSSSTQLVARRGCSALRS